MWTHNRRIFQNEPRCSSRRLFKCYPVYIISCKSITIHTTNKRTIDTEYADDIGKIIVSENRNYGKEIAGFYKTYLPAYHSDRSLQCNSAKTEEFTITRHGNAAWKICKYLGSSLDTKNDIKRRKKLAMTSLLKLSQLW